MLLRCAARAVPGSLGSNSLPQLLHFSPFSSLYQMQSTLQVMTQWRDSLATERVALFYVCPSDNHTPVTLLSPSEPAYRSMHMYQCPFPLLLAGWMESAPAVLRSSLEHKPPGFLQTIAIPLVDLLCKYLNLSFLYPAVPSTPLHPTHLPGILAMVKEYHLFLSSSAVQKFSGSFVEKIAMSVTNVKTLH